MLTIMAPAKLNLTLEVLGQRPDGYHEIRSVIQTISLCDVLHFEADAKVIITSNSPKWSAAQSLATKAIDLLQQTIIAARGVKLTITKNIPLVSGLGGDSSDAAATLRGLNKLWELDLDCSELSGLAAQLGSDVPFFLYGGTAQIAGRGEIVTPLPPQPHRYFVLLPPDIPPVSDKTRQLYASLKPGHYSKGEATEKLVKVLKEGGQFNSSLLYNVFENIAFAVFPGLKEYRDTLLKAGIKKVHLAGSGPTLYTIFEEKAEVEKLTKKLNQAGVKSFLTETYPGLEQPDKI